MKTVPIGVIRTPFKKKNETPIQPSRSERTGQVQVFKQYAEGLKDLAGFSHIILIYEFHRSRGYQLRVKPFLDNKPHGLFATRFPQRPNRIGISVVRFLKQRGSILTVTGIDVLDGTPLLDIKPYVPGFDTPRGPKIRMGWLKKKLRRPQQ